MIKLLINKNFYFKGVKMEIAKTILEQLGNNKFIIMTGAKNIFFLDDGLMFSLPRYKGLKINKVKITLNKNDLYDIDFLHSKGLFDKEIKTVKNVFCNALANVFTQETGLSTHL